MSSSTNISAPRWYIIHTKPKSEDRAQTNLSAWGIESFNPRTREARYNEFTGNPTLWSKPLFPRYIFARFDLERLLHKISFTRGVQNVVSFGGVHVPVDDLHVELIQSRIGEDGFVRMDDTLKSGDHLVVKAGPFKELNGIFDRVIKDSDRVMILLTTVKYQGSMSIERSLLRKVDPKNVPYTAPGAGI